eukprot:4946792-Lingulodinium_polyedra.AAC.1
MMLGAAGCTCTIGPGPAEREAREDNTMTADQWEATAMSCPIDMQRPKHLTRKPTDQPPLVHKRWQADQYMRCER